MSYEEGRMFMISRKRPLILVSNDDGVHAEGLVTLTRSLKKMGRVVVVAPDQQRSAASHSITLHRPLRINQIGKDIYAIDGTPTDCIVLAVREILNAAPDLIVSGINHGPNLGDDVHYSGTVSAAFEGGMLGIPSIAISLVSNGKRDFKPAANFAVKIARKVLHEGLPPGVILNINVPNVNSHNIKGYLFTFQGKRRYRGVIEEKLDPRGKKYYWIGGSPKANYEDIKGSDCSAIMHGRISITPLRVDLTDRTVLEWIKDWKL